MKLWKVASLVAAGVGVLAVIILSYSIPVNPCAIIPTQTTSDLLASASPKVLYDSSELVVIGSITDSTAKCEGSQIWTHMRIEVIDSAKNPEGIKVLTGKAIGGRIGNYGHWLEDSPIFEKGDTAFLYLYRENPDDTIYRISQYSGGLSNSDVSGPTFSAKEILQTFRLQSPTTSNYTTIEIKRGTIEEITLTLESFFGYDSPTNVTVSSFIFYNDPAKDQNGTLTSEYTGVSALSGFGITVKPDYAIIQPLVNGTARTQFSISASERSVPGVYDLIFSASPEDPYSHLSGGVGQTLLRVNVTDKGEVPRKTFTSEGITLGAPYVVQISWNLFETLHGNGTDLSVSIKEKETMEPLKQVTYDFGYKGSAELGGFQDTYVVDFSNPHEFRTGIKNPCDMHLTFFIGKVGDVSYASESYDTSTVGIQFRTFPEYELAECNTDNIKLLLFNGYDVDGHRVPDDSYVPKVTNLTSYDLPSAETLSDYTVKQVAEQHSKLCGESVFNSEIASMSKDDPNFKTWLPQRLHFVHIAPKEPIFRQGCFHIPTGIYYEHFIIRNNTAVPVDLSSNIIEIETPEQAVENIAYFEYGGKDGGVSILTSQEEYDKAVRECGEENSSPVRNIRVTQTLDSMIIVELNRINWNSGELEYQYWKSEADSTLPKLMSTIGIGRCGTVI